MYQYTYHSLDIHAQMQTFTYIHKHSQVFTSMVEAHSYRVTTGKLNWSIHVAGAFRNVYVSVYVVESITNECRWFDHMRVDLCQLHA